VRQQLLRNGKIGAPKYNSIRAIDMDPITHKALSDYRDFLGTWSGPLFIGDCGQRVSSTAFAQRMRRILLDAGIEDAKCHSHALRGFAGSLWISQGVGIDKVSRQLGHKNINMTYRYYIHEIEAAQDAGRAAMRGLHSAFGTARASLPPPVEALPMIARDVTPSPARIVHMPALEMEIPAGAPQWVGYAVRLLQDGWLVRDVAKHLGFNECYIPKAFKKAGMPAPSEISRTNTDKSGLRA
jgi:hypothetical protein